MVFNNDLKITNKENATLDLILRNILEAVKTGPIHTSSWFRQKVSFLLTDDDVETIQNILAKLG